MTGEPPVRRSQVVSIASTIVFAFATALPWFEIQPERALTRVAVPVLDRLNGWDVGVLWSGVPLFLGVALTVRWLAESHGIEAGPSTWPWASIHLGAGCAAAALVMVKAIVGVGGNPLVESHANPRLGLFVATIAAIGIGVSGLLYYREHVDA